MIFFQLSPTWFSDLQITKNSDQLIIQKYKLDFSITKPCRDQLKPQFLIKSGYYIVPTQSLYRLSEYVVHTREVFHIQFRISQGPYLNLGTHLNIQRQREITIFLAIPQKQQILPGHRQKFQAGKTARHTNGIEGPTATLFSAKSR